MQFSTKAMFAFFAATGAATLLQPTVAHAVPILTVRCSTDAIDIPTAKLRLEWARACGARINVISPTAPILPAQAYLTGGLSGNGGIALWEYIENDDFWGKNSWSGDSGAGINQIFTQNQWRVGPYLAGTVAGGFQRWTEADTFALTRPNYQTFGNNLDINVATQIFPNPNYSLLDCTFYSDKNAVTRVNTSVTGFFVNGFCTASCYTPDQVISFASGDAPILDALTKLNDDVKTLTPASTLDKIAFKTDHVSTYTREIHDSTHVIFDIRTKSGGELKVTDKHPVLVDSGRIMEAQSLKAGQRLIKADGTRDTIVSIEKTSHFGKVYNLKPAATNRVANILVAQGFLVGSSRYQNEDVDFMNRIILGRAVPKSVIPQ
jgi:Pretoxin HINT domain